MCVFRWFSFPPLLTRAVRFSLLCATTARWKTFPLKVNLLAISLLEKWCFDKLVLMFDVSCMTCVFQVRVSWLHSSSCLCLGRRSLLSWERRTTSLRSTLSVSARVTLTPCNRRKSLLETMCKHHTSICHHYEAQNGRIVSCFLDFYSQVPLHKVIQHIICALYSRR